LEFFVLTLEAICGGDAELPKSPKIEFHSDYLSAKAFLYQNQFITPLSDGGSANLISASKELRAFL